MSKGLVYLSYQSSAAPLGDSLKEEDVEHLVAVTESADWNMPTELKLKCISKPYRIEVIQPVL